MTVSYAMLTRNVIGNAMVDLLDVGTVHPNGYMEIRTGNKPASPQASTSGTTLLAVVSFAKPAFKDYVNGTCTANPVGLSTIIASGKAGWFRAFNRDGNAIFDGDIVDSGQDGEIILPNRDFIAGGVLAISTITAPSPQ